MDIFTTELLIQSEKAREIINITDLVVKALRESGVRDGLCLVTSVHTTASIFINEDEKGLREDIISLLERIAPENSQYRHNHKDPNAQAHLQRLLMGRSESIAITDGGLELGTWENVLFGEFDGPRQRTVLVKIIGS